MAFFHPFFARVINYYFSLINQLISFVVMPKYCNNVCLHMLLYITGKYSYYFWVRNTNTVNSVNTVQICIDVQWTPLICSDQHKSRLYSGYSRLRL